MASSSTQPAGNPERWRRSTGSSRTVAHGVGGAVVLGSLEIAVGLGVFVPRAVRWALVAGGALSLLMWVTVQDLSCSPGRPTDPYAGPLSVLLAISLSGLRPGRSGAAAEGSTHGTA
jgi:hypothetical protein